MSTLPPDRQAINGRTFGQSWNRADMDPFRHYRAPLSTPRLFAWAFGIGAILALVLTACARAAT